MIQFTFSFFFPFYLLYFSSLFFLFSWCCFFSYFYHSKIFRDHFIEAASKYSKELKLNKKKSYIIDVGSNDGVALKPFKDLKFKNILGVEPAKNLAKLANKNKIKTFNGFFDEKILKKISGNADLILASNVFAHLEMLRWPQ